MFTSGDILSPEWYFIPPSNNIMSPSNKFAANNISHETCGIYILLVVKIINRSHNIIRHGNTIVLAAKKFWLVGKKFLREQVITRGNETLLPGIAATRGNEICIVMAPETYRKCL